MFMMEKVDNNGVVKLAIAELSGVKQGDDKEPYYNLVRLGEEYRNKYTGTAIGEVAGISRARDLFKMIGIDPTKRRPSSEALLRRGLRGQGYSAINLLVDIGNWCSLEFLLPICVYDAASIIGTITGRIGKEGDGYIAIDENYLDLHNRYLIGDEQGAIGSPIKDSLRTRVTETTEEAVLLIYAPGYLGDGELTKNLDIFIERVLKHCGGTLLKKYIQSMEIKE